MKNNKVIRVFLLVLSICLTSNLAVIAQTTTNSEIVQPDLAVSVLSIPQLAGCKKNVGFVGNYYFTQNVENVLFANGHTIISPANIPGGLDLLDVLFIDRDGLNIALANANAIESWVRSGGILITEFSCTVGIATSSNYNLCKAELIASWYEPSGTVCGGNTVSVTLGHPLSNGLESGWVCSGDPIGVFNVCNLSPGFKVAATVNSQLYGDIPVVATCCADQGVWVAFFTDFADFTALENPRSCPNPSCSRSIEDETLLLNAVCLAQNACQIEIPLDIKPTSCPNPLNIKSGGVLPVAILGTDTLDVSTIDIATLKLAGISPLRSDFEDVATPINPFIGKNDCHEDCSIEEADGLIDLTLKFNKKEIITALDGVENGDCIVIQLIGSLRETFGSTPIIGEDVVLILKN